MAGPGLTLAKANAIIEQALRHGRSLELRPLGVAVLDSGGHLIAYAREDGSSNFRSQIATAKASGALGMGMSSRKIEEIAIQRPTFMAALGSIAPAGVIPAAGGVLIRDEAGTLVGAVGVSGDTSDNDELCALAGIAAAGLVAG